MADYIGWVITNKGRELLAKVVNHETKLNITKLEICSGYNTGNDRELTALINSKNHFLINSYERKDNASVEFTFVVSNRATNGRALNSEAYQIKEMGIFASDDAGVEILYAYNKGANGDYLPVFNGKNQIDIIEKCIITIDQQADMRVNIDNSITYVTYDGLRRELDKKVSKTDLATETNVGVVRYGTTEATALEGAKMAQMMGAEYGGLLQIPGQKEVGKAYYDSVNKQMVSPLENNTLTYYETTKFIPISGLQNANKVNNFNSFFEINIYNNYFTAPNMTSSTAKVFKIKNLALVHITVGFTTMINNAVTIKFPITFKEAPFVVPVDNDASAVSIPSVIGVGWASREGVLLSKINGGATLLVVGEI